MNMQLLGQYNLKFIRIYNKSLEENLNRIELGGGNLRIFLVHIENDTELIIEALTYCDAYLGGTGDYLNEDTNGLNIDFASVIFNRFNEAEIYGSGSIAQIIPLQDFRDVLQQWYDFITS